MSLASSLLISSPARVIFVVSHPFVQWMEPSSTSISPGTIWIDPAPAQSGPFRWSIEEKVPGLLQRSPLSRPERPFSGDAHECTVCPWGNDYCRVRLSHLHGSILPDENERSRGPRSRGHHPIKPAFHIHCCCFFIVFLFLSLFSSFLLLCLSFYHHHHLLSLPSSSCLLPRLTSGLSVSSSHLLVFTATTA